MNEIASALSAGRAQPIGSGPRQVTTAQTPEEVAFAFEKMLWSEMLSHAGLEKALTMSGGEGASAFSRMVVESIAEDLARQHPLGVSPYGQAGTGSGDVVEGQGEGHAESE